mmetsp:Transcript_87080/g.244251  ORF Transcript_87080/g.244251 Transcript_87080/m.244251 type:complete len:88 (-) Transcript_87080:134-397(-)
MACAPPPFARHNALPSARRVCMFTSSVQVARPFAWRLWRQVRASMRAGRRSRELLAARVPACVKRAARQWMPYGARVWRDGDTSALV